MHRETSKTLPQKHLRYKPDWHPPLPVSRAIYIAILLLLTGTIVSLPFISVNIYVHARGMLRPADQKLPILAPVSGYLKKNFSVSGQYVAAGDTLAVVDEEAVAFSRIRIAEEESQLIRKIQDLRLLISGTMQEPVDSELLSFPSKENTSQSQLSGKIVTPQFRQQLALWNNKYSAIQLRNHLLLKDLRNARLLAGEKIISPNELEQKETDYQIFLNTSRQELLTQREEWIRQLDQLISAHREIKLKSRQLENEHRNYIIRAPRNGRLQEWVDSREQVFLFAGNQLGWLISEDSILAECFISSKDIAYITQGMQCRIEVDAFDSRYFGFFSGTVIDIDADIISGENPLYRVRCAFTSKPIHAKNGNSVTFKPGMTLRTDFRIAERSIFELLFEKLDKVFQSYN